MQGSLLAYGDLLWVQQVAVDHQEVVIVPSAQVGHQHALAAGLNAAKRRGQYGERLRALGNAWAGVSHADRLCAQEDAREVLYFLVQVLHEVVHVGAAAVHADGRCVEVPRRAAGIPVGEEFMWDWFAILQVVAAQVFTRYTQN